MAAGAADALAPRLAAAVRYTDALVTDPRSLPPAVRREVRAVFTEAELVELTLTVAFASAFSKAAIAWGPPPDMPVIDVPTPSP